MTGPSRIIQDLRRARVLVVHPRDEDGNTLIAHLKRLGCEVRATWPLPPALPPDVDTVFLHVEDTHVEHALQDRMTNAVAQILLIHATPDNGRGPPPSAGRRLLLFCRFCRCLLELFP